MLRRLYPDITTLGGPGGAYLAAFFKRDLGDTASPFYSHAIRWGNTARTRRFLSPYPESAHLREDGYHKLISLSADYRNWSPLAQAQYLEVSIFLSQYLLSSQGDRVAMAHSVEGRFPFLDYRVVEFCNRLPSDLKLRGLTEKWLLKQLGRKLVPAEIWQRPKRPYRAPIHRSFFGATTPDYVRELLSDSALRESGLFSAVAVGQLVRKAAGGAHLGEVEDMAVAGILSTQLVHQQFVKDFNTRSSQLRPNDRVKVVHPTHEEIAR